MVIPASVKAITGYVNTTTSSGSATAGVSQGAFQNMTSLTNVTFAANNVTRIGAQAFQGCSNLSTISFPSSVTTINAGNANVLGAFEGSGLESVDLSKTQVTGATSANQPGSWPSPSANSTHGTFSNMPNLTTVTLPAGLQTIPSYAFYNSPKLKTVSFKATASTPEAQRSTRATEGTLDFSGASSLTSIGASAFAGSAVTSIDLNGATVFTTISNSAFMGMNELTTVKLPSTVTMIQENAFANDAKLATLFQESPSGETSRDTTSSTPTLTTDSAIFGKNLQTIGNSAFQGTGFKVVDLSATGVKSNISNNSTGLGKNAFTNLPNLEKVELPADADVSLAYFSTPAGSTQDWKIQYGSESELSSTVATLNTSGTSFSGEQFKRIANQTIEVAASLNNGTVSLEKGVFFGSSTLTTLKLNRTNPPSSGTNDLWQFQLGTAPNSDNTNLTEAYSTAPLGNNSNLNTIEFKGFTLGNGSQAAASVAQAQEDAGNTAFNRITPQTWSQVASIMNMFSKWENGTSSGKEQTQDSTTNAKPSNLAEWSSSSNSWINDDLTGSNDSSNKVNEGWTITNPSSKVLEAQEEDSSTGTALIASTKTATKTHNGVEWKYEKKGATTTGRDGNSTTNEITITGQVNIYKSKNSTNSYQTYFAAPTEGQTTPTQTVTVKLILVPAQATAEASRK